MILARDMFQNSVDMLKVIFILFTLHLQISSMSITI